MSHILLTPRDKWASALQDMKGTLANSPAHSGEVLALGPTLGVGGREQSPHVGGKGRELISMASDHMF